MVRHIVMWNLKNEAEGNLKEDNALIIKNKLEALVGNIEGLLKLEVRRCYAGYDLCLYSEFTDRPAVLYYKDHPLHKEVADFVHKVITERAAADFDI